MEKKLTVAIYTGSIQAPVFIENLIQSLSQQGIRIFLFGKGEKSSVHDYSNNISIIPTPSNRLLLGCFVLVQMFRFIIAAPLKYYSLLTHYRKIPKIMKGSFLNWWGKVLPVVNNLPDIFHIQWAKALPNWFFLKDLFGVKIVVSLRGAHINYSPLADQNLARQYLLLFPKIEHFHAVSKAIANEAEKYGALAEKIRVINSAVNLEYLKLYIKTNWEANDPFQFISVGRYHWKKGYHYALSAIQILIKNNMRVHYTIMTRDQPSEEILYQLDDLSLKGHVTLNYVDNQEDVYLKMSVSDCLLLPSTEEGIANVVLEAMTIGLPVISSDIGGMREVIEHGQNGFLFRNRDVDHLKEMMENVFNQSPAQRKTLINKAMKNIEKNYEFSKLGSEMKKLYHSIDFS